MMGPFDLLSESFDVRATKRYQINFQNMAGEVVVDALPYFDRGYDEPGVREAVSVV